ncbi:MAG: biotin carboxylase N-terminal domain-containing protein, partial [Marinilabilia sp.]
MEQNKMSYRHIQKIFIANRGEIALRIITTARKMGIRTVMPVTPEEQNSLPAIEADELHILQNNSPEGSYLNEDLMIRMALDHGADAIHPGYGFLSEKATFGAKTEKAGLIWIGPPPAAIAGMGNKLKARETAQKAGLAMSRAMEGTTEDILANKDQLAFPLLIKAAAGGGGKAMQIARNEEELKKLLSVATAEAQRYFGDNTVFVEEYIESPRHIEVQILGDHYGNVVHLFERECSIQRRYQKIIEEAPSPFVDEALRERLTKDAIRLAKEMGYFNAGTVEFLVDAKGQHYFLEMNTRIQVEHPVTEAITGIDMVEQQIKVAMGLPLGFSQDELAMNGHAIEARIYAEDALKEFTPSPGTIHFVKWPDKRAVRTDTFFTGKTEILPGFDPMLAKIIAHGPTREVARKNLSGSLEATTVLGITTNLPYLTRLIKTQAFVNGDTTTHFSGIHQEMLYQSILPNGPEKTNLLMAAYAVWLTRYRVEQSNTVWTRLGHYRWNNNFKAKVNDDDFTIRILRHSSAGNLSWSLNHKEMPDIENMRFSEHDITFTFNQKVRQFN